MTSHELEIILTRQFAECLSLPVFLTDTVGNLLFYNESAEEILGQRFEETGAMPVEEWSSIFNPMDDAGMPLAPESLPLVRTLQTQQPHHGSFWIESLSHEKHLLSVTSFPVIGRDNRYLGAVAMFWKEERS
jgi:PAS domain-containing protein